VVKRHSRIKTHASSKLIWIAGSEVATAVVMNHSVSCVVRSKHVAFIFKGRRIFEARNYHEADKELYWM
jgi:hypothetical protein